MFPRHPFPEERNSRDSEEKKVTLGRTFLRLFIKMQSQPIPGYPGTYLKTLPVELRSELRRFVDECSFDVSVEISDIFGPIRDIKSQSDVKPQSSNLIYGHITIQRDFFILEIILNSYSAEELLYFLEEGKAGTVKLIYGDGEIIYNPHNQQFILTNKWVTFTAEERLLNFLDRISQKYSIVNSEEDIGSSLSSYSMTAKVTTEPTSIELVISTPFLQIEILAEQSVLDMRKSIRDHPNKNWPGSVRKKLQTKASYDAKSKTIDFLCNVYLPVCRTLVEALRRVAEEIPKPSWYKRRHF